MPGGRAGGREAWGSLRELGWKGFFPQSSGPSSSADLNCLPIATCHALRFCYVLVQGNHIHCLVESSQTCWCVLFHFSDEEIETGSFRTSLGVAWGAACMLSPFFVSDCMRPHGLQPARLLFPWDSPGKTTGVGCQALLQGTFPAQGSNSRLLPLTWIGRQVLYHQRPLVGFPVGSDGEQRGNHILSLVSWPLLRRKLLCILILWVISFLPSFLLPFLLASSILSSSLMLCPLDLGMWLQFIVQAGVLGQ